VLGMILGWLLLGAVAGYLGRLLVPGPDPLSFIGTVVLGIVGSFVGGFLGWAILGKDPSEGAFQPSGLLGSVIGAVVALLLYNAFGPGSDSRNTTRS
jgi:uncharacterized membrane protein YeaQ/YmgE (transglycosylase-associated protein family)